MTGPAPLPAFDPIGDVSLEPFAVRLASGDDRVHELRFDNGALVQWSDTREAKGVPTVEFAVPANIAVDDTWATLPFVDDPMLMRAWSPLASAFDPLTPADLANIEAIRVAWVLHDGPFGNFVWDLEVRAGSVRRQVAFPAGDEIDVDGVFEVDFSDFVDGLLGELEVRDLIARGQVQASVGVISAVAWLLQREQAVACARAEIETLKVVRDWAAIVRSDGVREWVAAEVFDA